MHSCEVCGISFEEQQEHAEHMTQHLYDITVANKLFDCETCQRSFFDIADYDQHNRMIHSPY